MKHIVIVGGGSSGWLAAIVLSSHFPDKRFTVIDPTALGAIGVGESVTGAVINLVNDPRYGLDRGDFFRHCDATLKLGIWFKDWQGAGTEYLAPIDNPKSYFEHPHYVTALEDFYAIIAADGIKLGKAQIHAHLMRANKTDLICKDGMVTDHFAHASCHLDALQFADWLRRECQKRDNIQHVDDKVVSFKQEPEAGRVTHLILESGAHIAGDFFLDCSGLHRLLLQPAYQPAWIDFWPYIKLDRAIACTKAYNDTGDMPVYTTATAMPHGWMWKIPTQSRLGQGYLYSSRYITDDQAIAEMHASGAEPGDAPQVIRFRPGKLATQWQGNVCAIGLAGGFIEALESTTIHGMNVQLKLLAELFLPYYTPQAADSLSSRYNAMMNCMYDDYVDFISFHYHAGREDTAFWRDYQRPESITAANQLRMESWTHSFPCREDFSPVYTARTLMTSTLALWMPMLSGMNYLNQTHARQLLQSSSNLDWARENFTRYIRTRTLLDRYAIGQREAIAFLCADA